MSLWMVERVEFRARELDFTSSGQGRHPTTAVVADGTEIINALDLFDSEEEPMQTIMCDACGFSGCNSGSRVVVRRLDGGILLLPGFDAMGEGTWEMTEYEPPHFIAKRGSALFKGDALAALEDRIPFFADPKRWPALTMREAVRLLQWDAPLATLGKFPDRPRLREELISTASHGAGREAYDALDKAIEASFNDTRPVRLIAGEPVFFYIEPDYPEWTPLTFDGERYSLALSAGMGVEPLVDE